MSCLDHFGKLQNILDNTAWIKSFHSVFRYCKLFMQTQFKTKTTKQILCNWCSTLPAMKNTARNIHTYINVTFQKSTFALFIPQLKCSTFLVCFPFWILTTVRIKSPWAALTGWLCPWVSPQQLSALGYTSVKPSFLLWYQNEVLNLLHCQYLLVSLPIALTLLIDLPLILHYQRSDKRSRESAVQVSCVSPVVSPLDTAEDLSLSAAYTFSN